MALLQCSPHVPVHLWNQESRPLLFFHPGMALINFDKCSMSNRIEHINGYIFTSWLWILPVPTHIKYLISTSLNFSSTFYQLWHLDVCLVCVYFMPCFLGEEFFPLRFLFNCLFLMGNKDLWLWGLSSISLGKVGCYVCFVSDCCNKTPWQEQLMGGQTH